MGMRYKNLENSIREGVPGPGNYDIKASEKPPQYRFGTSQRQSLENKDKNVPGPGNYASHIDGVAKSAPKYGFGSGVRTDSNERKKDVPGPGTYN